MLPLVNKFLLSSIIIGYRTINREFSPHYYQFAHGLICHEICIVNSGSITKTSIKMSRSSKKGIYGQVVKANGARYKDLGVGFPLL